MKLSLLWTRLVVTKRNLVEGIKTAIRYYPNGAFCKQDVTLLCQYLLESPFTISKEFLRKKGEIDLYIYGETPLTTLEFISQECQITKEDNVIELGCGRGRACFWLRHFIGCSVTGIDYIPDFIEKANSVNTLDRLHFTCADFLDIDFSKFSVVYLYGTCLEEPFLKQLTEKLKALPEGAKVITVSYPITDYAEEKVFEVMRRFPAEFTWGSADVYLSVKARSS